MSNNAKPTMQTSGSSLQDLRKKLPKDSWILFTPQGGMIVSPDGADIKRSIDVILASTGKEP